MTRDQAILIARRIMDRCEIDRALHLDAIADEVMAGVAIVNDQKERAPVRPMNVTSTAAIMQALQNAYQSQYNEQLNKEMQHAMAYGQGSFIVPR